MNFQVDSEKMKMAINTCSSCVEKSEAVYNNASSLAGLPLPKGFLGDSGILSKIKSYASELKSGVGSLKSNCSNLYDLAVEAELVGNPDSSSNIDATLTAASAKAANVLTEKLISQRKDNNSIIENFEKKYGVNGLNAAPGEYTFDEYSAYFAAKQDNQKIETELSDLRRQNIAATNNSYVKSNSSNSSNSSSNIDAILTAASAKGANVLTEKLISQRKDNNSIIENFEKKYGVNGLNAAPGEYTFDEYSAYFAAKQDNQKIETELSDLRRQNIAATNNSYVKSNSSSSSNSLGSSANLNQGGSTGSTEPIIKNDIDLSGISQGYVSSKTGESVALNTDAAKHLVYDKSNVVNGEEYWHFKQKDGKGYAWFKADDVREIVDNPTAAE